MKILTRLKRFAQSTVQPYRVLGRTLLVFNGILLGIFLLLILLRLWLDQPQCGDVIVRSGAKRIPMVPTSCLSEQWLSSFVESIVDNLAAGLIVAMVSSALLWLISPKAHVEEDLGALEPWNIHELLHAPLAETKQYWFRGRSGRFMRSAVMPALFEAGGREAQLRILRMLLPDPADTAMLADYAHYRSSLQGDQTTWDAARIQNEILATIIAAARLSNINHFFEVHIYLKSDFSIFRLDMSDDQLVMTREDAKWPAILCSGRSKFYASYLEEFRNEAKKATCLDLSLVSVADPLTRADVDHVVSVLALAITLTDADRDSIIDAVNNPQRPYG